MAVQVETTYRKEIFNFLRTLTIKFEPFVYITGENYYANHAGKYLTEYQNRYKELTSLVTDNSLSNEDLLKYKEELVKVEAYLNNSPSLYDPTFKYNPYYLNLAGQYAPGQSKMTIYSVEEKQDIVFNRDIYSKYVKTAKKYKIPNEEYFSLEERYPDNVGLIKTIAYPTPDLDEIVAADNLSILSYDATILERNERESLLQALYKYIEMVKVRWWVPEYSYEDMYAVTFWAMLWQTLPLVLFAQRMKNIKTSAVHSFHIWEYLKSKGLSDYQDVLTDKQTRWLYRNINYLLRNKGKNSNIRILAKNLLDEIYVSLIYKDMNQIITSDWQDKLITVPKFESYPMLGIEEAGTSLLTSIPINSKSGAVKEESFATINHRLYDQNIEVKDSQLYIDTVEEELGTHIYNELHTKYVEFKKDSVNTMNEQLLFTFFMHNYLYRLSLNDLNYSMIFEDNINNIKIPISTEDAFNIWYWAMLRTTHLNVRSGEAPVFKDDKGNIIDNLDAFNAKLLKVSRSGIAFQKYRWDSSCIGTTNNEYLGRYLEVENEEERFSLDISSFEVGDIIKQKDTGITYVVVDRYKMHEASGYQVSNGYYLGKVPGYIYYQGTKYDIRELIDTTNLLENFYFWETSFNSREEFIEYFIDKFRFYLSEKKSILNSNSFLYHIGIFSWMNAITPNKPIYFNQNNTTYEQWFKDHPLIKSYFDLIEQDLDEDNISSVQSVAKKYKNVVFYILDLMFPMDAATSAEFIGNIRHMEAIYESIVKLFIQLCSYNITYLGTERDVYKYLTIFDPDFYFNSRPEEGIDKETVTTLTNFFDLYIPDLAYLGLFGIQPSWDIQHNQKFKHILALKDMYYDFDIKEDIKSSDFIIKSYLDYGIEYYPTWVYKKGIKIDPDIRKNQDVIHLKFNIHMDNTNILHS